MLFLKSVFSLELRDLHIVKLLVHGRKFLDVSSNTNILNATINFSLETEIFDESMASHIFFLPI